MTDFARVLPLDLRPVWLEHFLDRIDHAGKLPLGQLMGEEPVGTARDPAYREIPRIRPGEHAEILSETDGIPDLFWARSIGEMEFLID